ncbi:MAG TPA: metallophosphoesterase [Bacteroidia bacterium]|nr:metallophosphoesterase [Bacteroidia bacterium]
MTRHRLFLLAALVLLSLGRAAADEPWFFIQISDPQLGFFSANRDSVQDASNFEFVVDNVNRLRPEFLIVTGDLVHQTSDPDQIAEYRRIIAKVDPAIPVHTLSGNHDLTNSPTPETIAAYTELYGPDHYTFRHRGLTGIVLNSTLMHTPAQAPEQYAAQNEWLRTELAKAKSGDAKHTVIFLHHPWFVQSADEPDGGANLPLALRKEFLPLFHESGVRYSFSGHTHRSFESRDGDFENVTTGAVGKPLGGSSSGIRVVVVRDEGLEHHFFELGRLPTEIDFSRKLGGGAAKKPAAPGGKPESAAPRPNSPAPLRPGEP